MPAPDALTAAMDDLERRVRRGANSSRLNLESLYPEAWRDSEAAVELAYAEYALRRAHGEEPDRADWLRAYPQWAERFERLFGLYDLMTDRDTGDGRADRTHPGRDDEPVPITGPPGYRVHEELGRGGMAVVYRATQLSLNRPVALKVLRGGAWVGDEDMARLRREAEIVAKLRHPNVVPIYESGEWDGAPYLALELVAGGTLADDLTRRRENGVGLLRPSVSARLIETLARAVHAAHGEGVVHRDLKPANVLLAGPSDDPYAMPQIADFGLAIDVTSSASVTQTRTLSGTPSYMAPEQALGQRNEIGPRSDIYSLGAILYELLTGWPPHEGATILDTLDQVRHAEPRSLRSVRPDVSRDLETVCLKALAKDPARRYDSALAFADDLHRVRDGKPILARPVRWPERAWKRVRRHPVVSGLAASLLIATAAAAGLYDAKARQARKSEFIERENARLEDVAATDSSLEATRTLLKSGLVKDARARLDDLPERLRDEVWHDLRRVAHAHTTTYTWPVLSPRVFSHSGSEDGRHLLVVTTLTTGQTNCNVCDVTTGKSVGRRVFDSVVYSAAMGSGLSMITITAAPTKGTNPTPPKTPVKRLVQYWDFATNRSRKSLSIETEYPVLSENGLFILRVANEGRATLFDVAKSVPVASWSLPDTAKPNIPASTVSNGGRFVIYWGGKDWLVYPTADPERPFPIPTSISNRIIVGFSADEQSVFWLESTTNLPQTVTNEHPFDLVRWDLTDRTERFRVRLGPRPMTLRMSPDGEWFAAPGGQSVALYRTRTGERVCTLYGTEFPTTNLCFSRDNRQLYTYSRQSLKIWNLSHWTGPKKNVGE